MALSRDELLALDDEHLLRQCRQDCFRVSGPGGQHRNRTDSAVRLTLRDYPAIVASAVERRSQHQNRSQALWRLRLALAHQLRASSPPPPSRPDQVRPSLEHPRYPAFVAGVLDALAQHGFQIHDTALALGTTTGQLNKTLARDPTLFALVNRERQKLGLKPLHD